MTIHWKAVEQYCTVVLFVCQFYPVCNYGKFISLELGAVKSEIVKRILTLCYKRLIDLVPNQLQYGLP